MSAIFTIVEKVYWQEPEDDPICVETTYSTELPKEEEPYQRSYTVQDKCPLDTGWLEDKAGWVVIKNRGQEPILLGYEHDGRGFIIPPSSSIRIYPENYKGLQLSASEPTRVSIAVFPR